MTVTDFAKGKKPCTKHGPSCNWHWDAYIVLNGGGEYVGTHSGLGPAMKAARAIKGLIARAEILQDLRGVGQ